MKKPRTKRTRLAIIKGKLNGKVINNGTKRNLDVDDHVMIVYAFGGEKQEDFFWNKKKPTVKCSRGAKGRCKPSFPKNLTSRSEDHSLLTETEAGKQKIKGGELIDIYITIIYSYKMNLNTIYIFYNKSIAFHLLLFTGQICYFVYTFGSILLENLRDMHKKNISQDTHSPERHASSSRFVDLATRAALIASIFSSSPSYTQSIKKSPDLQKKNTIELVDKNTDKQQQKNRASHSGMLELVQKGGNIEHQKIIKKNISTILSLYGQEKGMEIIRKHMLIEINTARAKIQAPAMKIDTILTRMAQEHAQDMRENNYFDHKDSEGHHVWDRAKEAGYKYSVISENIANDNTIEGVISGFVHSTMGGHERILSREYEYMGIGVEEYYDGNRKGYAYFVLDFASPLK